MLPSTREHSRASKDSFAATLGRSIRQRRSQLIIAVVLSFVFLMYLFLSKSDKSTTIATSVVDPALNALAVSTDAYDPFKYMSVLSWKPRIFLYKNFLSAEECDYLINLGRDKLERSKVVGSKQDEVIADRSSSGYWITYDKSEFVDKKIAAVTHLPLNQGEQLHLLHYEKTQQYKPHMDWFPRGLSDAQEEQIKTHGQRIATMIIFLAEVEEGGETWFPKPDIKVKPHKGDAVLFYDLLPHGEEDGEALHGGMPVIKGEKWIVTKWLRQKKWASFE
jgi:hypothetical protein